MPFDDKEMKFDEGWNQYILTKDYVLNHAMVDEEQESYFRRMKNFDRMLRRASDDIYRYVYRHSRRNAIPVKQYMMNEDETIRPFVKRAMLAQMEYYMTMAAPLVKMTHGLDFERMRFHPLEELRGARAISPDAEDILHEAPYLMYSGHMWDYR